MKTAIVTGGTHKDVSAIGVLALNIKEVTPQIADEMIVFHDGISKKNQQLISNIFPTKFYRYQFDVGFKNRRANRSLRYFSEMLFCKYECFRLLEYYDRVIWTDYDVLIRTDLHELMESQEGLQIVESSVSTRDMFLDSIDTVDTHEYDLEQKGVATPIFVLTRNIGDYGRYYNWCIEKTKQYAVYTSLPEQCIISMLIQKFHIEYKGLSAEQYAMHPREDTGQAYIVHAYGRPKFWEGLRNEKWEKYYEQWIALGGSRYRKPVKEYLIAIKEKMLHVMDKKNVT